MEVDRKTIALNAPIAELSIAAPERLAEVKDQHIRCQKLAGKCLAIHDSPDFANTVAARKKGKFLFLLAKEIFTSRAVDLDVYLFC